MSLSLLWTPAAQPHVGMNPTGHPNHVTEVQPTQATLLFGKTRALSAFQQSNDSKWNTKSVRVYEVCKEMNNERNVTSN